LGCLLFFTLSKGRHPFDCDGNPWTITNNIWFNRKGLQPMSESIELRPFLIIIELMIRLESQQRPSIEEVLKHPSFKTEIGAEDGGCSLGILKILDS
jgi:hypothetical protein